MRRNNILHTSVALAAVAALLGACSDSDADAPDKAGDSPSSSATSTEADSTPTGSSSTTAEESALPDGVQALPGPDADSDFASIDAGRYRVTLTDTLAFDIDVADDTSAHDSGLFLATGPIVIKTEVADDRYGVPRDPCTNQTIKPVGPTVDDLVQALTDLSPYQVSSPEPVELGGARGTYLEAQIPRAYDTSKCDRNEIQLPGDPETAVGGPAPYIGRWWILDVDGQRVVVQQNCWACSADQLDRAATDPQTIAFTPTP